MPDTVIWASPSGKVLRRFNPMPDYDFVCQNCKKQFTAQMSIKEHDSRVAECPECKSSKDVQRAISHFNLQTSKKSSAYR
jgi:putative FmdB family regulatory protein